MDKFEKRWLIATAVPGLAFWFWLISLWEKNPKINLGVWMLFSGGFALVTSTLVIGIPLRVGMNLLTPGRRENYRGESIGLVIAFSIIAAGAGYW